MFFTREVKHCVGVLTHPQGLCDEHELKPEHFLLHFAKIFLCQKKTDFNLYVFIFSGLYKVILFALWIAFFP